MPSSRVISGTFKIKVINAGWLQDVYDFFFPKTWPRWLCWWFGHEPTEPILAEAKRRCRCGVNVMTDERLVRAGRPNWWTRLVRRLPAHREQRWPGVAVQSSYRPHGHVPGSHHGENSNHAR